MVIHNHDHFLSLTLNSDVITTGFLRNSLRYRHIPLHSIAVLNTCWTLCRSFFFFLASVCSCSFGVSYCPKSYLSMQTQEQGKSWRDKIWALCDGVWRLPSLSAMCPVDKQAHFPDAGTCGVLKRAASDVPRLDGPCDLGGGLCYQNALLRLITFFSSNWNSRLLFLIKKKKGRSF